MAADQRPHVLAFPYPALGHINPMLYLCQRLSSMGVVITFLNTETYHKKFESHQVQSNADFKFLSISDDYLPSVRMDNNLQLFLKAIENMRPEFESILQDLMNDPIRPPVKCIISDAFVSWTQDVAANFRIYRASLWTCNSAAFLLCLNLHILQQHGLLPVNGSTRVVDFIPGHPHIRANHLPETLQVGDPYDPGFKARFERYGVIKKDQWVFGNSVYALEQATHEQLKKEVPRFLPVGLLLPDHSANEHRISLWEEDVSCLDWLDKQKPDSVIYISFGSVATLNSSQMQGLITGLERSGHAFLWVIRLDLLEGDEHTRNKLLQKLEQNPKCLMIPWAPQLKVLHHPAVAAFLTHCGWNSVTEAISAGVPMLCKPCFAEQNMNCAIVVDILKIGVRATDADEKLISANGIEKAIHIVMDEEGSEMRKRAKHLSDECLNAARKGGSSYGNLQTFIKGLTN